MKLKNPNDTLTTGGFLILMASLFGFLILSLVIAAETGWLQYIPHF